MKSVIFDKDPEYRWIKEMEGYDMITNEMEGFKRLNDWIDKDFNALKTEKYKDEITGYRTIGAMRKLNDVKYQIIRIRQELGTEYDRGQDEQRKRDE